MLVPGLLPASAPTVVVWWLVVVVVVVMTIQTQTNNINLQLQFKNTFKKKNKQILNFGFIFALSIRILN